MDSVHGFFVPMFYKVMRFGGIAGGCALPLTTVQDDVSWTAKFSLKTTVWGVPACGLCDAYGHASHDEDA